MGSKLVAIALAASLAGAPPPVADDPPPAPSDEIPLDAIRAGVARLRAGARTDGTWGLVGNLISAGVAIGLAVWIGTTDILLGDTPGSGNELTRLLVVASLTVAAASQIADGLYDVVAEPATVTSADYLLSNPDAMEASGLFFLENRALDGRDRRIRGAISEMTSALGAGIGAGLLFASDFDIPGRNIIAGISIGLGGIQLITGMLKLFRRSTEEQIYDAVLDTARRPPAYEEDEEPGGPSFGTAIFPDTEGGVGVAVSMGMAF